MPTRHDAASVAAGATPRPRALRTPRPRTSRHAVVQVLAHLDAGDRAARGGDRGRALSRYGRALDECLGEGLFGMATTVARRMIEHFPDVVRARMTLAVLPLAEGARVLPAETLQNTCADLESYVTAAQAAGREDTAARQLRRIADATDSAALRARIGELLSALGQSGEDGGEDAPARRGDGARPVEQYTRWIDILVEPPPAG